MSLFASLQTCSQTRMDATTLTHCRLELSQARLERNYLMDTAVLVSSHASSITADSSTLVFIYCVLCFLCLSSTLDSIRLDSTVVRSFVRWLCRRRINFTTTSDTTQSFAQLTSIIYLTHSHPSQQLIGHEFHLSRLLFFVLLERRQHTTELSQLSLTPS